MVISIVKDADTGFLVIAIEIIKMIIDSILTTILAESFSILDSGGLTSLITQSSTYITRKQKVIATNGYWQENGSWMMKENAPRSDGRLENIKAAKGAAKFNFY